MTTKHTPGPWHYAECQMGTPFVDTASAGDLFAAVLPLDEERANVRLMAAAPDLLHVAEMVLRGAADGALYGFAEAAVRKAKGEL